MTQRKIDVFTDGSVSKYKEKVGNVFYGSYAIIFLDRKELFGRYWEVFKETTINQMELMAIIKSLEILKEEGLMHEAIYIYSDSEYSVKGFNVYLPNWLKKNWCLASGKPVKNKELWVKLLEVSKHFPELQITHVKAHQSKEVIAENYEAEWNDKVDKIATGAKADLAYAMNNEIDMEFSSIQWYDG